MEIEDLIGALDALVALDSFALEDGETLVELERQLVRLESVVTRSAAAFDGSGSWSLDGARSAPAWVATRCHLPRSVASRQVRRGRALRQLGVVGRAYGEGSIGAAQVDRLTSLHQGITETALERDEQLLVDQAQELTFSHFTQALTYWEQLADPDGVEDTAAAVLARRDAYLTQLLDGVRFGQMTLDPIGGAIVGGELERLETELFEADWAKAKAELGRDPKVHELGRTPGQRRADAFVEMATRSAGFPEGGRRPEPLFTVMVGWETFKGRICQLAQGQPIAPGSLVPWLEQAQLERAVFAPGRRVEISCRARLFTGATRRAIEVRDQECTHPFCEEPADRCQCDHIIPYANDGPTTQENGRLLCGFHNRLRNQRPPPKESDDPDDPDED